MPHRVSNVLEFRLITGDEFRNRWWVYHALDVHFVISRNYCWWPRRVLCPWILLGPFSTSTWGERRKKPSRLCPLPTEHLLAPSRYVKLDAYFTERVYAVPESRPVFRSPLHCLKRYQLRLAVLYTEFLVALHCCPFNILATLSVIAFTQGIRNQQYYELTNHLPSYTWEINFWWPLPGALFVM